MTHPHHAAAHPSVFTPVVRHPSFRRLAALLRLAGRPSFWRARCLAHAPLATWIRELATLPLPHERTRWLHGLTAIITAVQRADPRLTWSAADLDWFLAQLDAPESATVVALLLASSSATVPCVTLTDLAHVTGESPGVWHARCQHGAVPGAELHSFGWLIPTEPLIIWMLSADQSRRLEHLIARRQRGERDAESPTMTGGLS